MEGSHIRKIDALKDRGSATFPTHDRNFQSFPATPDRLIRLQERMADTFPAMVETTIHSGWTSEEVAAALVELADNHMLSVLANRDFARDLAGLTKSRRS